MFCPRCRDEFRPGFTRCGKCNVDLIEDLSALQSKAAPPVPPSVVRMADFCGFLTLEDARDARDQLRPHEIRSEIVIREPLEADWSRPAQEEFWIRVDVARYRDVERILGDGAEDRSDDDTSHFRCSECDQLIAAEETFCPKCGARFED